MVAATLMFAGTLVLPYLSGGIGMLFAAIIPWPP